MDQDELIELALRFGGTVSHESAARWWGWRVEDPPAVPSLTVPRNRSYRPKAAEKLIVYRRNLTPSERLNRFGVPITSPLRTCLDLAASREHEQAVITLDSALESHRVRPYQLARAVLRGPGAHKIRRALRDADGRSQSVPETILRLWLASDPRVGRVVPQMRLCEKGHPYDGGLPDLRTVVEFQSWEWHAKRAVWVRDARWGNQAYARGWGYVQLVHEDILLGREHVIDLVLGNIDDQHRAEPRTAGQAATRRAQVRMC